LHWFLNVEQALSTASPTRVVVREGKYPAGSSLR